jgi:NitT/TauT family transport system substrate-binding protein
MPRTRPSIAAVSLALCRNLAFAALHVPGCREASRAIARGAAETRVSGRGEEMVMMAYDRNRIARAAVLAAAVSTMWAAPANADVRLRFSLGLKFEGPSAPFLVGLDKGYYKAEGLDVTFDNAADPADIIKRVAAGDYAMGFGDINLMMKFRDENPKTPVTAVFIGYDRPAYAIVTRKSRGVTQPKDLEGKRLGAPETDSAFGAWKIFARANGIDAGKVTIDRVSFPVREPMLAAGQVDAVTGYSFSSYITLKDRGVPVDDIVVLLMADYGVDLYGNAIIVNPKFAAEQPDAVKGFLRAYLKGLKETARNPTGVLESVTRRNEEANKATELERLRMALRDNILTPDVKQNGLGGIDAARFDKATDQIVLTYSFKTRPKLGDVFDASFLPPAEDRKVN